MSHMTHGFWYRLSALILILSSITTIILTSFNLHNLLRGGQGINLTQFRYGGEIGRAEQFCNNEKFLKFGWLCGFLTIPALFTGILAFGVRKSMSAFTLFFLIVSALTGFVTSVITAVGTCLVLSCHVTLTGLIPSGILFIGIFSVLQCICSLICFFKVCVRRSEEALDLKYGLEPLPDPWELAATQRVLVEGAPRFNDQDVFPIYAVGPPTDAGVYSSKVALAGNYEESPQEKRIVLNNPMYKTAPQPPRQQLLPTQCIVRPFQIDRVSGPPIPYSQHEFPFNCRPLV